MKVRAGISVFPIEMKGGSPQRNTCRCCKFVGFITNIITLLIYLHILHTLLGRAVGFSSCGVSASEERFTDPDFVYDAVIIEESMGALIRAVERLSIWACECPG